jgi:peptidoglycan/LPS O-acetylase OafA/YrhL
VGVFEFRKIDAAQRTTDSFPLFDWLRFALASAVALTHEGVIGWDQAGNLAVQVFFALSGWLIGGILIRSERRDLPRFYFNRATRIWIPYFIAVAVLYAVAAARDGVDIVYLRSLFFDSTFTHNWFINPVGPMPLGGTGAHFWSISVEEQFYLAAPLLIVLLPFGRSVKFWLLVACAAVLSQWWYGAISLGVLAAVARDRFGDWHLEHQVPIAIGAGTAFAALLAFPAYYDLAAPFVAVGVVLLCARTGQRGRLGEFAGGASYPLYLYHWMGMFAANVVARGAPFAGLLAYGIAVAAGVGAYLIVDRNVMRRRAGLYSPRGGKILTVAAYSLVACGVAYQAVVRI